MQSDYHSFLKGEKKNSKIAECFKRKFKEINRKKGGAILLTIKIESFFRMKYDEMLSNALWFQKMIKNVVVIMLDDY